MTTRSMLRRLFSRIVRHQSNAKNLLMGTHAVEVDFTAKWYEALGQSLYYSMQAGKRAGILLIIESNKDLKY